MWEWVVESHYDQSMCRVTEVYSVLFQEVLGERRNHKNGLFQWSLFFNCRLKNQQLRVYTLVAPSIVGNPRFKDALVSGGSE